MLRTLIIMTTLAMALQACVPGSAGDQRSGDAASAIAGEEIAVTTLADPTKPQMVDAAVDAEAIATAEAPATKPKPRPEAVTEAAVADVPVADVPVAEEIPVPEPEVEKSREQLRCEKGGGRWVPVVGSESRSCVKPTRDAGKSCEREGQCQGQCLARSKTCAPFDPLWGCNEVLQKDGSRVTLCLN